MALRHGRRARKSEFRLLGGGERSWVFHAASAETEHRSARAAACSRAPTATAILQAEGERQSAELRAQGFAAALKLILEVAGDVDQTTMTLQYLETLKQIGSSPSTKFVVPVELTNMLAGLVSVNATRAADGASARSAPSGRRGVPNRRTLFFRTWGRAQQVRTARFPL